MANGASGSPLVALINAHTRDRSPGCRRADVGHISARPDPAISTSPSRSNDSTCAAIPANKTTAAAVACRAVTGRPRKIPRATNATAASTVNDHSSRPVACQPAWSWPRAIAGISQHAALSRANALIQRAAGELTWTTRSPERTAGATPIDDSFTRTSGWLELPNHLEDYASNPLCCSVRRCAATESLPDIVRSPTGANWGNI